jgi:hypothetical protein
LVIWFPEFTKFANLSSIFVNIPTCSFGKKYSFAEKWLASVGYAGLEYALEKVGTFKILNDVKKTVKSFPSAEQALFRSGVKESFDYASQVGKASAREGLTELATSLGQTEMFGREIAQSKEKLKTYTIKKLESLLDFKRTSHKKKNQRNILL